MNLIILNNKIFIGWLNKFKYLIINKLKIKCIAFFNEKCDEIFGLKMINSYWIIKYLKVNLILIFDAINFNKMLNLK